MLDSRVSAYAGRLAAAVATWRPVGVYVHGSAVLGGFRPGASDVDVLVVVPAELTGERERLRCGAALAAVPGCPGTGLESSVVTAATARDSGGAAPPFEVHVNTVEDPPRIGGDPGGGDPDLVLHAAVCRAHGVAVSGPPAAEVFGPVPRARLLTALAVELRWGAEHAGGAYAVLNACRALRYAADGTLCAKVDGGRWWLAANPGDRLVAAALAAQSSGGEFDGGDAGRRFALSAAAHLDAAGFGVGASGAGSSGAGHDWPR